MIRSLLYSLSLHVLIVTIIYASFNLRNIIDIGSNQPVEISFVEVKKEENNKNKAAETKKEAEKEITEPKATKIIPKPKKKKKIKKKKIKKTTKRPIKKAAKKTQEINKKQGTKDIDNKALTKKHNLQDMTNIKLLGREKNNFILQIKRCYKNAIRESSKTSAIPIKIGVNLNINGSAYLPSIKILNKDMFKESASDLKIAFLNAKRTLEICSPIRNLPKHKYNIWKNIELVFDGKTK